MTIARTVERFLIRNHIPYDLIAHPRAEGAQRTATATHVPPARMAKAVVLEDMQQRYVMVVIPAQQHLSLKRVEQHIGRPLNLASEPELTRLFSDCNVGAVPPLGPAYGIETYIDSALLAEPEIYFEAGDHKEVVHMPTQRFVQLLGHAERGAFTRAPA